MQAFLSGRASRSSWICQRGWISTFKVCAWIGSSMIRRRAAEASREYVTNRKAIDSGGLADEYGVGSAADNIALLVKRRDRKYVMGGVAKCFRAADSWSRSTR